MQHDHLNMTGCIACLYPPLLAVMDPRLPPVDEQVAKDASEPKKGGLLSSFVRSIGKNVMGTAALREEDIAPALEQLHRKLMERNVAHEIARK